jgi:hypothetical protein
MEGSFVMDEKKHPKPQGLRVLQWAKLGMPRPTTFPVFCPRNVVKQAYYSKNTETKKRQGL